MEQTQADRPQAAARVLSVNVGKARAATYKGREALSGIEKTAAAGSQRLGSEGFEGDEQADRVNHGGPDKAVCVYSSDHYPHWQKVLGRKLEAGAFGENLTIAGLLEEDVRIGDVFRVGTATVQVSQPRVPCWKLAMRWGLDELPALVSESGSTGFYFRVLETGEVSGSAELALLTPDPAGVTVREANRIMHRDKKDAEGIRRLLAVEALADAWRETLKKRLAKLEAGQ